MINPVKSQSQLDQAPLPKEAKRRRQVIQETLGEVLSHDQMVQAISLCDREFPEDQVFSSAAFCGKLIAELPELNLTHSVRLNLLRRMRQQAHQKGVDSRTQGFAVPHKLLEAEPHYHSSDAIGLPISDPISSSHVATPKTQPEVFPSSMFFQSSDTKHPHLSVAKEVETAHKHLSLPGHYWTSLEDTPRGTITVAHLTLSSLSFDISIPHHIKVGNSLSVQFTLDDTDATMVWQRVEVNSVTRNHVKAFWSSPDMLDTSLRQCVSL